MVLLNELARRAQYPNSKATSSIAAGLSGWDACLGVIALQSSLAGQLSASDSFTRGLFAATLMGHLEHHGNGEGLEGLTASTANLISLTVAEPVVFELAETAASLTQSSSYCRSWPYVVSHSNGAVSAYASGQYLRFDECDKEGLRRQIEKLSLNRAALKPSQIQLDDFEALLKGWRPKSFDWGLHADGENGWDALGRTGANRAREWFGEDLSSGALFDDVSQWLGDDEFQIGDPGPAGLDRIVGAPHTDPFMPQGFVSDREMLSGESDSESNNSGWAGLAAVGAYIMSSWQWAKSAATKVDKVIEFGTEHGRTLGPVGGAVAFWTLEIMAEERAEYVKEHPPVESPPGGVPQTPSSPDAGAPVSPQSGGSGSESPRKEDGERPNPEGDVLPRDPVVWGAVLKHGRRQGLFPPVGFGPSDEPVKTREPGSPVSLTSFVLVDPLDDPLDMIYADGNDIERPPGRLLNKDIIRSKYVYYIGRGTAAFTMRTGPASFKVGLQPPTGP